MVARDTDDIATAIARPNQRTNYRRVAFQNYDPLCAPCGFGVAAILEVAHVDCNRSNNAKENLVILCPTCHKMYDLDLISAETILLMRDRPRVLNWRKWIKDGAQKAAATRRRAAAARKAAATRALRRQATR